MAAPEIDVAVVGAGVSGTYTAWRLSRHYGQTKSVALFEYSNRIGGRLYSRRLPGMPHLVAELGGMRFMPQSQQLIGKAVETLSLATRDFPMGSPVGGAAKNFALLRNKLLRQEEFSDPAKVPYDLSSIERGKTPDQLRMLAQDMLIPNSANLTYDQWFDVQVFGRPLWSYGYWNLLYRVLSPEAYSYVQAAGGYDTNVVNGNAVSMLPIQEKGAATEFKTLVDGMQSLPKALAAGFRRVHPQGCFMNHLLRAVRREKETLQLTFELMKPKNFQMLRTGEHRTVSARQLVLAMPRMALESIDWPPLQQPGWLSRSIRMVFKQHAFKLMLGYEAPWWHSLGLQAGRSITDMPIRQTYYFGTEGQQKGADPNNLNSLMMASYNDTGAVPFWRALEDGEPFIGKKARYVEDESKIVPPSDFPVTQQMIEMAQIQIARLHDLRHPPEPYTALYHDWSDWPFGGGWHQWKAGYNFLEVLKSMPQPVSGEPVHICGEAYSRDQGWVEGALETAEDVLARLGVPSVLAASGKS
jgi:monoamine oxidase